MGDAVTRELVPRGDFISNNSSGHDWEDERNIIPTSTVGDAIHSRRLPQHNADQNKCAQQKRTEEGNNIAVLPKLTTAPTCSLELPIEYNQADKKYMSSLFENERRSLDRATPVSLRRLDKDSVRLVQTRSNTNSSRQSIRSNHSDTVLPIENRGKDHLPCDMNDNKDSLTLLPPTPTFQSWHGRGRHENVPADSFLDAHATTMRALEPRDTSSPTESWNSQELAYLGPDSTSEFPGSFFCSTSRRTTTSSLSSINSDQRVYIPSHYSKSPCAAISTDGLGYLQPQPLQNFVYPYLENGDAGDHLGLDSVNEYEETKMPYDDHKGRRVLGLIVREKDLAHRSRIKGNDAAQGVANGHDVSGSNGAEAVVWLSLQRGGYEISREEGNNEPIRFVVPCSYLLHSSSHLEKTTLLSAHPAEFDDKRFAEQLRSGHRKLAGSWFRRTFSCRRLSSIHFTQSTVWSGTLTRKAVATMERSLAAGNEINISEETRPSLTEGLTKLFKEPMTGEAKYIWVQWVRQITVQNSIVRENCFSSRQEHPNVGDLSNTPTPTITTIEFLHTPSTFRILIALVLALLGCTTATLLWAFMGPDDSGLEANVVGQWSGRPGSGVWVGILVLLWEGVGFGMWIVLS